MRERRTSQEAKQDSIEEAYRRGYHHGLSQALDLMHGLLLSGMPTSAVAELCHAYIERVVIPWRTTVGQSSSAPPRFDLDACQRLLREMKEYHM